MHRLAISVADRENKLDITDYVTQKIDASPLFFASDFQTPKIDASPLFLISAFACADSLYPELQYG